MKILLAVDGSPFSKRLLAYLAAHPEWLATHHRYTVLTVTMALPSRAASALDKDTVQGYYEDEHEKVFKSVRSFLGKAGVNANYLGKVGSAAALIAKTADSGKFDLVMMGSHGHNSFGSLLLGSVTTRVLTETKVPVLIVR